MVCATVRQGCECVMMSKRGCQFNGGSCHPVVAQCDGCQRILEIPTGKYCMSFPDPSGKWKNGVCNMASHIKANNTTPSKRVNPLKASKRSR
ncbi:MAG: PxxKW family cysteine-rich protein [Desulfatiglandales bacterium]